MRCEVLYPVLLGPNKNVDALTIATVAPRCQQHSSSFVRTFGLREVLGNSRVQAVYIYIGSRLHMATTSLNIERLKINPRILHLFWLAH